MLKFFTRCAGVAAAAALLALAAPPAAAERTLVEALIAERNPCAGLRTEQFGQSIGIDELDDVTLREADISLRGDDITVSFSGRLACRSPAGALLRGDAAADVTASATISVADCGVRELEVEVGGFDGTFGPALAAFAPRIEQALADEAEPLLVDACREFRGNLDE